MGTRKPINFPLLFISIFSLFFKPCISWTGIEPEILNSENRITELFHQWRKTHGKTYNPGEQTGKRFENFRRNLRYVVEGNSDRVGLNRFADLSNEEFREMYFGKVKRPVRVSEPEGMGSGSTGVCDAPVFVDWREKGVVTEVKDQGVCGSSWAFSSVGAIEGIIAINNGELISLSEQLLIDCDENNNGCDGGEKEYAFEWVVDNGGIYTQADYPYSEVHATCNANKVPNNRVYVHGYEKLEESESALLCATVRQPISVGVHGSSLDFQLYTGGIYDGACSSNPNDIDHSVLIVGYNSVGDKDYWIVKNSWGPNWGMNGYMYILRNTSLPYGVCAINSRASYPTQTFSAMSPSSAPPFPSPMSPSSPSPSPPPPPQPYFPSSPPPPSSHLCGDYSYCGRGQTCCCLYEFSGFCMINGCCDYIDGVCCSGTDYCCPREYPICDPDEGICLQKSGNYLGVTARKKNLAKLKLPWRKPEEHTEITFNALQWRKAAMRL